MRVYVVLVVVVSLLLPVLSVVFLLSSCQTGQPVLSVVKDFSLFRSVCRLAVHQVQHPAAALQRLLLAGLLQLADESRHLRMLQPGVPVRLPPDLTLPVPASPARVLDGSGIQFLSRVQPNRQHQQPRAGAQLEISSLRKEI